jgi:Fe-S cluster assembly scaffold protein SufB
MPQTQIKTKHTSSLGVSIGLGPEVEENKDNENGAVAELEENKWDKSNPYDPNRIIKGEDGEVLPHITDFEPYRKDRMSNSDRAADAWFTALLESEGGESFLGSISAQHKERLLSKVELVDEPVLKYGEDEEWTPYVVRRLPTSPLYPAYGLETYGLPVLRRGAEAWRHFDVNGLIAVDYSTQPEGIGSDITVENESVIATLKEKGAWLDDEACAARLVYVNGRFCPGLSKQTDNVKNLGSADFEAGLPEKTLEYLARLPDGFTDELAAEVPDDVFGAHKSLEKLSGPDHNVGKATSQFAINNQQGTAAFAALNSVKAGSVAYVEAKDVEKKPVLIINAQTPSGGSTGSDGEKGVAFHPRTLAVANDGSVLSLVQMCVDLDESSDDACATLVNGYTQIFVGSEANVTHSFLEESGGIVTSQTEMSDNEAAEAKMEKTPREIEAERPALRNANFQAIDVHITGDDGSYSGSLMELGGCGRSRIAISTSLLRPGAFASINGFALSGGAQRSDMRTCIHHMAQGTTSRQEQRNMVGGRSTGSFRGRIRVEQSAQQTDSQQLSRTILLSDNARVWATPSLEIIADDVQCTHGATVSDLSEEELFYLRSRGLDRTTSRNLLMYAFVEEIGSSVDETIAGGFDDENGLRSRIIKRLENLVPEGEKILVGGEFQSV